MRSKIFWSVVVMVCLATGPAGAGTPGTLKWAFPLGGGLSSPALAADGTIYVGGIDGNLYAIKPDGTKKWAFLARCS